MTNHGHIFEQNKVRHVTLVHGTFAGNDALGLFDLLEPAVTKLANSTAITNQLKVHGKQLLNSVVKDLGNFTPEYAKAFGEALGSLVNCKLFTWGSGNFHLARLIGAVELAKALANTITRQNIRPGERVLLVGHSHAGQLFSLITLLLENGEKARQLYEVADKHENLNKADLVNNLKIIQTVYLDFVTFGTPVRYPWGRYEKYRLMPVINHRSNVNISGLLSTRDGDYIQQWGIEGTDIIPPDNVELNDTLDNILDKGRGREGLIEQLKIEQRQSPKYTNGDPVTQSVLIDYKDNAKFPSFLSAAFGIPHCIKTLFGHGVYTKHETLRFNINLITNSFYQSTEKTGGWHPTGSLKETL